MNGISPEYRLDRTGPGGFMWGDWQIDEANNLMTHRQTRAVFVIYPSPDADLASLSMYQLRARFAHVCDGHPIPPNLSVLGAQAINAYTCMTERLILAENQPLDGDDDIPF